MKIIIIIFLFCTNISIIMNTYDRKEHDDGYYTS